MTTNQKYLAIVGLFASLAMVTGCAHQDAGDLESEEDAELDGDLAEPEVEAENFTLILAEARMNLWCSGFGLNWHLGGPHTGVSVAAGSNCGGAVSTTAVYGSGLSCGCGI